MPYRKRACLAAAAAFLGPLCRLIIFHAGLRVLSDKFSHCARTDIPRFNVVPSRPTWVPALASMCPLLFSGPLRRISPGTGSPAAEKGGPK